MKTNNVIIVGGTIAAGKSTLVKDLSKKFSWQFILELVEGDKIQNIILDKLYEGKRIHQQTIQYYFLVNRVAKYKEAAQKKSINILDRGLWEDIIFAKLLNKNNKVNDFKIFETLWTNTIKSVIKTYGLPKAYIFLKVNWDTFKKRIYGRNRLSEINNFYKNETYFRKLVEEYNKNFVNVVQKWDVNVIAIDTDNLNKNDVLKEVIKEIKKII